MEKKSNYESWKFQVVCGIAALVVSVGYGWWRGLDFWEFCDHIVIVASFGGLIPGILLTWIIWDKKTTEKVNSSEKSRFTSIEDLQKLDYIGEPGYYKSSFVIKLHLEKNILMLNRRVHFIGKFCLVPFQNLEIKIMEKE